MYPSEFETAAPAFPADSDLFLSVPPVILLLFVLLLLLALLCGWYAREQMGPKPKDPCDAVYDDIRKAAEAALKASRDEVHARARGLLSVIERRLGGVLALAEDAAGPCATIRDVLEPRPEKHEHHHPAEQGTKTTHGADLVFVNTGRMMVHAGDGAPRKTDEPGHGPEPEAHHDPAPAPDRRSDRRDEIERLRGAVHAFADHWRDRPRRLAELRRARANLC